MQTSAGIGWALASKSASGAAQPASPRETRNLIQWQTHEVAKIPEGYQVAVADVNGDGRLDILALSSAQSIVEWYENPTWKPRPITTATQKNISLAPLFHPGYPARGLALASDFALDDSTHGGSLWWAEPAADWDHEWRLRPLGKIPTSHRLRWANLDGTGRLGLVDAPLLGFGAVAPDYKVPAPLPGSRCRRFSGAGTPPPQEAPPPAWPSHLIDDSLTVVHGLNVLDWDGDGRDEILTASFEGVHLFHSAGHRRGAHLDPHAPGRGRSAVQARSAERVKSAWARWPESASLPPSNPGTATRWWSIPKPRRPEIVDPARDRPQFP